MNSRMQMPVDRTVPRWLGSPPYPTGRPYAGSGGAAGTPYPGGFAAAAGAGGGGGGTSEPAEAGGCSVMPGTLVAGAAARPANGSARSRRGPATHHGPPVLGGQAGRVGRVDLEPLAGA